MIRLYRLVPIAAPLILLLATMQLMAASAAPTMAKMPPMKNTSSTETSQTEGLMFWSQSVGSGERMVLLQWQQVPDPPQGHMFDRGNNGVMLMGLFEIQIYDSYTEKLYPDGQAASVYGQTPPMVNACRKPGQWQTFDIIFYAPVFRDGKLEKEAYVTVLHNGLLVHHNQKIYGPTGHRILPGYDKPIPGKLPLSLSAHNNPVRFRNIWIRPL